MVRSHQLRGDDQLWRLSSVPLSLPAGTILRVELVAETCRKRLIHAVHVIDVLSIGFEDLRRVRVGGQFGLSEGWPAGILTKRCPTLVASLREEAIACLSSRRVSAPGLTRGPAVWCGQRAGSCAARQGGPSAEEVGRTSLPQAGREYGFWLGADHRACKRLLHVPSADLCPPRRSGRPLFRGPGGTTATAHAPTPPLPPSNPGGRSVVQRAKQCIGTRGLARCCGPVKSPQPHSVPTRRHRSA